MLPGAGEAYDKVARLLGLELKPSGGAAVEALAREGDAQRFKFSTPLRRKANCNFSYAGLKTAVRLAIQAEVSDPPSDANRQVQHLLCCCLLRRHPCLVEAWFSRDVCLQPAGGILHSWRSAMG